MISDNDLHRLAVFLGSVAVLLLVLYHFLDVNTLDAAAQPGASSAHAGPAKVLAAPGGIPDKGPVAAVKELRKNR